MQDQYLTMEDLRNRYKVSRDAIYDWTRKGFPRPYKLGGNTSRWKLSEVTRWEEERTHAFFAIALEVPPTWAFEPARGPLDYSL